MFLETIKIKKNRKDRETVTDQRTLRRLDSYMQHEILGQKKDTGGKPVKFKPSLEFG